MSNYNHARFLPESLGAILDQSYRPQEVIVIDDGSTDNSIEVIESFAQRCPIVRLFRNDRNRGVNFSANLGLEVTSGDYIHCAGADDRVLPGFYEKSMNLLAQYPQAGLCTTLSGVMNDKGEYKGLLYTPFIPEIECFLAPEKVLAMLRRHGNWFMTNTAVYRRRALIGAGGFIPALGFYSDAFMAQGLALKYGACFIPEVLAMFRRMKDTYSERMSSNLDTMLDIAYTVKRLMRSAYRDLFPADYADDWTRGWLYEMGKNLVTSSQTAQLAGLRRLFQSPSLIDRAFFGTLRLSMMGEYLVTKVYLFACFRRGHRWQSLRRKLKQLWSRGERAGLKQNDQA